MPKAWWSKEDDARLRAIEKVGRPAMKRYRTLVVKRYRTPAEEEEREALRKVVLRLERSYRAILGRNPFKKLIEGK